MAERVEATFICSVCGETKPRPVDSVGTGYGLNRDGAKVCYQCCAVQDMADMDSTGRAMLYLSKVFTSSDGAADPEHKRYHWEVTNWPGSLRYRGWAQVGRHNWGLPRYDVWFKDHAGREWHGVTIGDNTELCHCRRLKASGEVR